MNRVGAWAAGAAAVMWVLATCGAVAQGQQAGGAGGRSSDGAARPSAGAGAEAFATTGWTATSLDEDHEVARLMRKALDSGKVFDVGFHLIDTAGLTPEQVTAARTRVTNYLIQCRGHFPAVPRYAFADGAEFAIEASSQESITFLHGMADDPRGHPSTFRLPTRQRRQVYLVYVARDTYGDLQMIHVLLWQTADGWRAADMAIHPARLSGLTAQKARTSAEAETTAGRHVLGLGLYSAVGVMAPRAPYRAGGLLKQLQEPIASLAQQLGLPDRPIDVFRIAGESVPLRGASAVSHKGRLYLLLWHDCPPGMIEDEAIASIQGTLAYDCLTRWPQTKEYFWGVSLTTPVPGDGGQQRAVNNSFSVADLAKAAEAPPAASDPPEDRSATTRP